MPKSLKAVDSPNEYFFWTGQGTKKSVVGDYQRAFKKLYVLAGVKNGHAHRWRDTFAVGLLDNGASLESVSLLLGHQDIKVTQKHYASFVKSRQEQLIAEVRRSWKRSGKPNKPRKRT